MRPLPSPLTGSPPITRTTLPTCRAHYPGGSSGCACRLLPRSCSLPQMAGGSASALSLSRPAQASLTLRPARSLSRLWRPLSRGSGPAGYPAEPLVSYRINRQLSGWNLPPLMIRAFGAHGQQATLSCSRMYQQRLPGLPFRDQCAAMAAAFATLRPLPSPLTGLPRLPEPPFRRAVPTTPADQASACVDCFPAHAAFPKWQEGRHPHCHFRGLLRLHSR